MEQGSQSWEQETPPRTAADVAQGHSYRSGDVLEVIPNPRGGTVPGAERALGAALDAFEAGRDAAGSLVQAANALRAAGWASALRFTEALLFAEPQVSAKSPGDADASASFGVALRDFRAAVVRHNLWELSCSDVLFAHYQGLRGLLEQDLTRPNLITLDELALAGRPVPPATLYSELPPEALALWRARYERALLTVLRAGDEQAALAAFDTLEACFAALSGPDPYDAWRLAAAVLRVLRGSGRASLPEAKRLYARFNLLLAEQARGSLLAPAATVRYAVALLWRGFALHGSAHAEREAIELLRDYGLSVNSQGDGVHDTHTGALRTLWDAETTGEPLAPAGDATGASGGIAAAPGGFPAPGTPIPRQSLRGIGALRVHVLVYEDFLQTADAAIAALAIYAAATPRPNKPDASAALQAGDAAYRLGTAACAVGLGGVATLADALGLAWRRVAHAAAGSATAVATNSRALEDGAEALRRMLHQVAAGVAPADPAASLADLIALIESDRRGSGVLPLW